MIVKAPAGRFVLGRFRKEFNLNSVAGGCRAEVVKRNEDVGAVFATNKSESADGEDQSTFWFVSRFQCSHEYR